MWYISRIEDNHRIGIEAPSKSYAEQFCKTHEGYEFWFKCF